MHKGAIIGNSKINNTFSKDSLKSIYKLFISSLILLGIGGNNSKAIFDLL